MTPDPSSIAHLLRFALLVGALTLSSACGTDAPSNSGTNNDNSNTSTNAGTNNEPDCTGNLVECNGSCVNTTSDVNNCGACGTACGTGASCLESECTCVNGATDCNGDLGQAGSDGCECSGACDGTMCAVPECDAATVDSCSAEDTTICNSGTCGMCPANAYNCDGLGTNGCECDFPCVNGACPETCDADTAGACDGDTGMWCDGGACAACADGMKNCDTTGACECEGTCDGTACNAPTCTYEMENACDNDDSMWCSSVADNTCVACSSGFFNCNNKLGCECDSAGCDGEMCAGNCMSGLAEECP